MRKAESQRRVVGEDDENDVEDADSQDGAIGEDLVDEAHDLGVGYGVVVDTAGGQDGIAFVGVGAVENGHVDEVAGVDARFDIGGGGHIVGDWREEEGDEFDVGLKVGGGNGA